MEYERLHGDDPPIVKTERLRYRWSTYAQLQIQLAERATLGSTLFVQPRIGHLANVRVLSDTALTVAMNQFLSIKVALQLSYDSRPPAGVLRLDRGLDTALSLTL